MYFRSSISLLRFVFLLLAGLGLSGCPGSWSKKQEVDPLPGVIRFDYSKIRIAQQYSGRAYVHIRLYLLHGPALADPNLAGLESLAIETAL
ncbi:MAG TPA: hypothetical protein ENJ82_10770, partial [Bacteroidetes bacterium]|nr:hypothetical protein [Bacteroidota bacterium]